MPFRSVESLLAIQQRIADDQRTPFQNRLKNLHRLGFPRDLETVPGRATQYTAHQYVFMAIAVELLQLGISPERAVSMMRFFEKVAPVAIGEAASYITKNIDKLDDDDWRTDPSKTIYIVFDPSSLSALMELKGDDEYNSVAKVNGRDLASVISSATSGTYSSRFALINITNLLRMFSPPKDGPLFEPFFVQLMEWALDQVERSNADLEESERVDKKA